MIKNTSIGLSLIAALLLPTTAIAEHAVKADPKHYTVEFENDRIRVVRIKYGPGEKSVMHSHGPSMAVYLTDTETRMTFPDGTSVETTTTAGDTEWADAGEHLPKNLSDSPVELVLIELKD
jgi:quercetin dioxygenase-like cupin family protein